MDLNDPAYQPQFKTTRRAFLAGVGRGAALLALGGVLGALSGALAPQEDRLAD